MARQAQLVSQHLENISHEALSKYQDVIRSYVRGRQGIYALYRKNELYYVGLASNLRSRLKHHLRDRHKKLWDRFSVYLTIGDSHLKELESLILRTVKPSGNHQSGKFIKSENLRGKTFPRPSCSAEARNQLGHWSNYITSPKKAPAKSRKKRRSDPESLRQPVNKTTGELSWCPRQSACTEERPNPVQEQRL